MPPFFCPNGGYNGYTHIIFEQHTYMSEWRDNTMKKIDYTLNEEGLVPSACAEHPSEITSPKYAYINTKDVISEVQKYGWSLVTQSQANTKKPERMGYQKHILIFEHPEFRDYADGVVVGRNQLVVRNSHDNTSSLQLFLGYMRLACANQIFAKSFGREGFYETVKHIGNGDKTAEAITRFNLLVEKSKIFQSIIKQLGSRRLSESQQKDFAERVIDVRFNGSPFIKDVTPESILLPRRNEDIGNDAWTVFNRVQENIVKGGLVVKTSKYHKKSGKPYVMTTRAIRSPSTLPDLNNRMLQALNDVVQI